MGGMDPSQVRRFLRVYRAAKAARNVKRGYRKAKGMLDAHAGQTDLLLDAAAFAERVRENRVQAEDVREGARVAVNSLPHVYRFVARHVRKHKVRAKA